MAIPKVVFAAALLVALVAVASATTFTTTVTTTSYDEEENYSQCKQQVQGRQFRACQSYLKQRSSSPYEDEEEVLANPQQRESIEQCCEQLREMDRQQCGCEAIKRAVKQVQQGSSTGQYQTGQSEQIYRKARALPRMCKLREQQCRFNVVFV